MQVSIAKATAIDVVALAYLDYTAYQYCCGCATGPIFSEAKIYVGKTLQNIAEARRKFTKGMWRIAFTYHGGWGWNTQPRDVKSYFFVKLNWSRRITMWDQWLSNSTQFKDYSTIVVQQAILADMVGDKVHSLWKSTLCSPYSLLVCTSNKKWREGCWLQGCWFPNHLAMKFKW